MSNNQKYRVYPYIHNREPREKGRGAFQPRFTALFAVKFRAEELGIAVLGSRFTEVVPRVASINRADYGRSLARLQGGIFTSRGYIVPDNGENTGLGA